MKYLKLLLPKETLVDTAILLVPILYTRIDVIC